MKLLLAITLLSVCSVAHGQQIYRCQSKNGQIAFQQTPCPETSRTTSVRSYVPEPDSPINTRQSPRPSGATAYSFSGDSQEPRIQRPPVPANRSTPTDAYLPSRANSGKSELLSEERRLRDQYGNSYEERPDSNFVRDRRTGKLCYRYGSQDQFINCN
jgi:hypothetical protein